MKRARLLLVFCFLFLFAGCASSNEKQYTISFVTNGGLSLEEVSTDEKHSLPTPTKDGYLFRGWYSDEELNIEFDENKQITSNISLFAKWEAKKFTIIFEDRDGYVIDVVMVEYAKDAVAPAAPVEEGMAFIGWSEETTHVVKDMTVRAMYSDRTYTISLSKDGANVYEVISSLGYRELVTLPTLYEDGLLFVGWLNDGVLVDRVISIKEDMLLVAYFQENSTFTLTVDDGVKLEEIIVEHGKVVNLKIPSRAEYLFMGWFIEGVEVDLQFQYDYVENKTVKAKWSVNLEVLKIDGNHVVYRASQTQVMIPSVFEAKEKEFRAAWVTAYTGDIATYKNRAQYEAELLNVLDVLTSYNMNAIVFHVRIQNDAMYRSGLNPQASQISGLDLKDWDYLEWFIEQCHQRGIEFHAWLNPYRIKATGYSASATPESVAQTWPSYNVASKQENILMTSRSDGGRGAILNPGKEAVQQFVIASCMELVERYQVDAIHFDDYFYANMGANGSLVGANTILNEADQSTYSDYIDAHPNSGYRKNNANDKANWRREQINLFIEGLSDRLRQFNIDHGRRVQLGVSPTGIYKNGNGVVTYDTTGTAVTTGSNTAGQEHFASYLFCDSKKWVDEGWIDYIVPQTYWAFTHPVAGYADVVDWWAKVVKNKSVRLYTGMGLYMADANNYSWRTNPLEASQQILYNTKHPEIKGTVVFSFQHLRKTSLTGMNIIKNQYWSKPVSNQFE